VSENVRKVRFNLKSDLFAKTVFKTLIIKVSVGAAVNTAHFLGTKCVKGTVPLTHYSKTIGRRFFARLKTVFA